MDEVKTFKGKENIILKRKLLCLEYIEVSQGL